MSMEEFYAKGEDVFSNKGYYLLKEGERVPVFIEPENFNRFDLKSRIVLDERGQDAMDKASDFCKPSYCYFQAYELVAYKSGVHYLELESWINYHFERTKDKCLFYRIIQSFVESMRLLNGTIQVTEHRMTEKDEKKEELLVLWLSRNDSKNLGMLSQKKPLSKEEAKSKIEEILGPLYLPDSKGKCALNNSDFELLLETCLHVQQNPYEETESPQRRIIFHTENKKTYVHLYRFCIEMDVEINKLAKALSKLLGSRKHKAEAAQGNIAPIDAESIRNSISKTKLQYIEMKRSAQC